MNQTASVIISVRFDDEEPITKNYSTHIVLKNADLFEAEAAARILSTLPKTIVKQRAQAIKLIATEHNHPSYPCSYDPKKKEYSCGEKYRWRLGTVPE